MTDDLRTALDTELDATAPPSPINGPEIVASGRRSVRRHRLARIAVSTVAAAVAVVLGIVLIGPAGQRPLPPDMNEQPSYPLPSLDPGRSYSWTPVGDQTYTEETRAFTLAFWSAFSGMDAGVETGIPESRTRPATIDEYPRFSRHEWALVADDQAAAFDPPVHTAPHYGLTDQQGGVVYLTDLRSGLRAELTVTVYPSGSYLREAPNAAFVIPATLELSSPYIEPNCAESARALPPPDYTFTCTGDTGANGEHVARTVATITDTAQTGPGMVKRVVVYQPNGNAIVLQVTMLDVAGGDGVFDAADRERAENAISVDALTAVGLRIPELPVR